MSASQRKHILAVSVLLATALSLQACGRPGGGAGFGRQTGPVEVGVLSVKAGPATVSVELPGRTTAYLTSEVRPQVSGIIRRRLFAEGSQVKEGTPLYEIEPSLYRAAAQQAAAQLASAQANLVSTRLQAERYRDLVSSQSVSRQEADNADAAAGQARASVALNRAAFQTAQINLRYTIVRAPIAGQIGRSSFTQGALVSASQTDPLATIQSLDPIYVDIQQSADELDAIRRAAARGGQLPSKTRVTLKLSSGTDYPIEGVIEFSEASVNPATGTVTLRARFNNPDHRLLPGMFVRAFVPQYIEPQSILVPQPAVTRDARGQATVMVVGRGDVMERRSVRTSGVSGDQWIVTDGLSAGERVVVEGLERARVGDKVVPKPATVTVGGAAPPSSAKLPAPGVGHGF